MTVAGTRYAPCGACGKRGVCVAHAATVEVWCRYCRRSRRYYPRYEYPGVEAAAEALKDAPPAEGETR
jgi:hypothetical protein